MFTLRVSSPHRDNIAYKSQVERWQLFLIGRGFDLAADGDFGPITERATKEFQARHGLRTDGKAGNRTLGLAMSMGLEFIDDEPEAGEIAETSPLFPARPADLSPPNNAAREAFYGHIGFRHTPREGNREAIRITNGWDRNNIIRTVIPQLIGVNGAPNTGGIRVHKKIQEPIQQLFSAWEAAGLSDLILGWAGSYVPRLVRGSSRTLSNHAYGAAFDINVPWNPLGARPALVGERGSVRQLVPLANEHGFYWGGHYNNRKDGMHFEYARFD